MKKLTLILITGIISTFSLLGFSQEPITPKAIPVSSPKCKVEVDLSKQTLKYQELQSDGTYKSTTYPVSTGRLSVDGEYITETGTWTIENKESVHVIRNGPHKGGKMPFACQLGNTGRFIHAGLLPGYPASDGCVRMHPSDAEVFFMKTPFGTKVTVVGSIENYFEKNFNPYRFLSYKNKGDKIEVTGFKKNSDGTFMFEDELIEIMKRENRKLARFAPLVNGKRSTDPKTWYLYFPNIMEPQKGISWAELEAFCRRRKLEL